MTQLEQARKICNEFERSNSDGSGYVYAFTGKILKVNLQFCELDGHAQQCDWSFDCDFSETSNLCYVGEGLKHRIASNRGRKLVSPAENRIMLMDGLTKYDRYRLERALIQRFGRICDPSFTSGVLANIADGITAPRSIIRSSRYIVKMDENRPSRMKGRKRLGLANSKPMILCDDQKNIIDRGYAQQLSEKLDIAPNLLTTTANGIANRRTVAIRSINQRVHVCWAEDFPSFVPLPGRRQGIDTHLRKLIGVCIKDGRQVQGTAAEIRSLLGWKNSAGIHSCAQPDTQNHTCRGWIFKYAD